MGLGNDVVKMKICQVEHSGAGLRPVHTEGTYVQEGGLLEVPVKLRRSPRPATQNATVLSARVPADPSHVAHPCFGFQERERERESFIRNNSL
jgi:hypothetical protein